MDIKQEEIGTKDDVPTTFNFQSDGDQDVDDSVPSMDFERSNQKRGGIEDDFKSIGSNIMLKTENGTLMDIKREEIDINDDVPTTFTFQSNSNQDIDDSVPSMDFERSNQERGRIVGDFRSIDSNVKLETEDETLMNIKQDEVDTKDEVPSAFNFQTDDSVPPISFPKSNQKPRGIKDDFKSIGSGIKLEPEDETLMNIKQEEIDINEDVPTTFTFQSGGDQDVDDSIPTINFQKSNQERGRIEDDFRYIGSNIKLETEDKTLMNIKQEEVDTRDEVPTAFNFQTDDSVPSISFLKSNQKPREIKDDFKSIGSGIKLEPEDETLINIKQEEIYIKDEIPSTSTFHSNGDLDIDDNASSSYKYKTHRDKLFVCNICDYKSAKKSHLTVHMICHTGEKPFVCDLCDFKSARKSSLTIHMRRHTGEKPFACDLCDFKSTQNANLTVHMKIHTGEKPFACSLCYFRSARKNRLTIHMRSHTGEKPFACGLCYFKSAHKSSLAIHMRSHTGEKPFACGLCGYKSAHKGSLAIHMRSHTGEKPFTCGLCGYKSAHKGNLAFHTRSHTGEKPFTCHLCGYKSAHNGSLAIHMRTHTGEKPFACDLCDFKSDAKCKLVIHMKRHINQ